MSGINNFNINLLNDTDRLKDMLSNNTNLLSLQARTLRIRVNDNNENILHIYCKDKRCKRSGALHGEEDQAIKEIIEIFYEYAPHAFMQQTKLEKQTPLHFAMKSGNIQKAKAIFEVLSRNVEGKLAKEVQDSSLENNSSLGNLFNILDYNGMRAIDLLAIRQDTEYKKSITGDLEEEKLETPKISKNYDVYSWRTYDSYPDGVHTFRHDAPKLLDFEEDPESNKIFSQTSITHVEMNEDYSMALTEDGQVYSWGMGPKGKLGLGEKEFTQAPGKVNFVHYSKIDKIQDSQSLKEFELEYQQIKESKSKITKLGGREQLIHLYSTATNFNSLRSDKKSFGNRKKNSSHKRSLGKERSFTDEDLFKEDGIDDDLQADSHGYEQLGTHKSDMINMHLFWSAIEKVYVTQISCSENHTLACTNTGSVYGWGSNEFSQLGFQSHRENTLYISCPKKIFGSIKKSCIQRVAAGDKHSLALSVEGLVHGWGDNHSSQLGLTSIDGEIVPKPVELDCVNNFTGSKSRRIKIIRAKGDTSLFLSESSRCFVSDPESGSFSRINLESGYVSNCFLGPNYVMIIDTNRGIHFCSLEDQNMTFHDYTAVKILEKSNFIGFCCNSNKIWGLNSKRQVLIANLATEGKEANTEKKAKQNIIFEPYNDIFNVMKISSNGNQNCAIRAYKKSPEVGPDQERTSKDEIRSLENLCIDKIINSLTLDIVFDIYQYSDSIMCDRLKINVIKFLALNIVSLFERAVKPQVSQLPQYLWHDLENFIKSESGDKYSWQNFKEIDALPKSIEAFGGYSDLPSKEECEEIYSGLLEIYNSNQDSEENTALLQRAKEVKSWCRKLMKKIRNRKNTSLDSASSRAEGESPQKDPSHEDDDIFISDEDIDVFSEDLDSSSDEETEDIMTTKYEMYSEFYSTITLFIQEYIGDEIFKNFVSKRKHSSENPFVFEVFQSQNKRKNAKKAKAVRKKKKMKQAERKLTAQSQNEEQELVIEASHKVDEKQKNREMKKLIKDLLPKEPPKPTCYLDDEPEYQIVEVRGEYKKVKVQKDTGKVSVIEGFAGPKKSSENHWCLPQEKPECHLQDIIQKEKEEEEQKQKLEEQKKRNEEEAKQKAADDEMMKLAIEISMKEFEEEQEKQEKERKEKKLANNSLAQSLKSGEAKNKFSKKGFVPKSLRKEPKRETPEENISENEHWNYGYRSRPRGRGGRGRYGPPFRGRRPQRGYYHGY